MAQLLNGAFPLLRDPDLRAIGAYQMEHEMGGSVMGNMGYAIIDKSGVVRAIEVDPLFGRNVEIIIETLQGL